MDEGALGREHRHRLDNAGKQASHALGQREVGPDALATHDQQPSGLVRDRDARARAGQGAADAGAKPAEALQPGRGAQRKRFAEPGDLPA
jgi:hypothetical protein